MFDFYQPYGETTEPRALIIFLHPGAFILGDKSDYLNSTIATEFARCGFAAACVNYHLIQGTTDVKSIVETAFESASEKEWPVERQIYDAVRDVRTAIRYFKNNAQVYHIDPNRIYLVGYSAGAIIALNIGFLDNSESARSFTENVVSDETECLDCIPCYGETTPQNFDASVAGLVAINGALFDLSCVSDADVSKTPMLLVYSNNDDVIPLYEGKPFQKMLDKKNIKLDLPSIAFELGLTKSTKTGELEKTTVNGLDLSIVLPKWLPTMAASGITPKVYGSKAILNLLREGDLEKLEMKGGHNFVSDPESGDLNANYEELCKEIKSFISKTEKNLQKNKPGERRRNRRGQ